MTRIRGFGAVALRAAGSPLLIRTRAAFTDAGNRQKHAPHGTKTDYRFFGGKLYTASLTVICRDLGDQFFGVFKTHTIGVAWAF